MLRGVGECGQEQGQHEQGQGERDTPGKRRGPCSGLKMTREGPSERMRAAGSHGVERR